MKEAEQNRRQPCATALAAARAAQEAVAPDTVILFGSRARGDHRPDSDIDLLVIHREDRSRAAAKAQRIDYAKLKQMSLRGEVNAIGITRDKFNYARRAKNHVAAQALRDGVIMSGEKLDYTPDYDDGYPANWPDIQEWLQAAHDWLHSFDNSLEDPQCSQRIYGFLAQQAVENAIKGWLSAADLHYDRIHDLDELAEPLLQHPAESDTEAADQLRILLEYTAHHRMEISGNPKTWLTRYAAEFHYSRARYAMDELEKARFQAEIRNTVRSVIDRIHRITGTTTADWQ